MLLGGAGQDHVRTGLGRSGPAIFITQLQDQEGLREPSTEPVLRLLDLHRVPRATVYRGLVAHLRAQLIGRLGSRSKDELLLLLAETFAFVKIPELQPLVLAILAQTKEIPPQYITALAKDDELYGQCSIEVKRQIWQVNGKLFRAAIAPHVAGYTSAQEAAIRRIRFEVPRGEDPKQRRDSSHLQQLVRLLGTSVRLYNLLLEQLRAMYVSTGQLALCTLRVDLLMALHQAEVVLVYSKDACHEFAWSLTACVRDGLVDKVRCNNLNAILARQTVCPGHVR